MSWLLKSNIMFRDIVTLRLRLTLGVRVRVSIRVRIGVKSLAESFHSCWDSNHSISSASLLQIRVKLDAVKIRVRILRVSVR